MTEDELQEHLELLRSAGYNPRLCDTAVPHVDVPVIAGYPAEVGDAAAFFEKNYVLLPRELVGNHPVFHIDAMGDSMSGIGINDGDTLEVRIGSEASDGDVVVAEVDGCFTVKTFFNDGNGMLWLVPENDSFKAIPLTGHEWRILGRVTGIRKGVPRSAFKRCAKAVMRTKQMEEESNAGTAEKGMLSSKGPRNLVFRQYHNRREIDFAAIRSKIERVIVKQMRHRYEWYAAYRVLMDLSLLEELQLKKFAQQMQEWFPDVPIACTADSLGEYAVGHTACAFALWDSSRFRADRRKGQSEAGFNTLFHRCEELRASLYPLPVVEQELPF